MLPPLTKFGRRRRSAVGHPSPLVELDGLERPDVHAAGVVHIPVGIRARHDGPPELLDLVDGVDRDVPGAGDDTCLAVEGVLTSSEHLAKKTVPYPVASVRTCAPPHSVPLPVRTPDS